MKRFKKALTWAATVGCTLLLILIAVCHFMVVWNASGKTCDNVENIPYNKAGLLLATSPINKKGQHNYNFDNRIVAADELYKAGKINFIIASGGDYTQTERNGCNEPQAILDSLVARGIPQDRILLDYEGTRTLNSIAKAKLVYGLGSITLISQKYHNERAIYQAEKYGIHATGYNAKPSPRHTSQLRNTLRELMARPKMFLDFLTHKKPDIKECPQVVDTMFQRQTEIREGV